MRQSNRDESGPASSRVPESTEETQTTMPQHWFSSSSSSTTAAAIHRRRHHLLVARKEADHPSNDDSWETVHDTRHSCKPPSLNHTKNNDPNYNKLSPIHLRRTHPFEDYPTMSQTSLPLVYTSTSTDGRSPKTPRKPFSYYPTRLRSPHRSTRRFRWIPCLQWFILLVVVLRFGSYIYWIHTRLSSPNSNSTASMIQGKGQGHSQNMMLLPGFSKQYPSGRILDVSSPESSVDNHHAVNVHSNDKTFETRNEYYSKPISVVPPSKVGRNNHDIVVQPPPLHVLDPDDYLERCQMDREFTIRKQQRRQQTRPPIVSTFRSLENVTRVDSWKLPIFSHHTISPSPDKEPDWKKLCMEASLDHNSRVVITGILSQPPAMALALLIAKQCRVQRILGIDLLFPNQRLERIAHMKRYRTLLRSIPNFTLKVPYSGLRLRDGSMDFLQKFGPMSHVVFLHTQELTKPNILHGQVIMNEQSHRLYSLQHSLVSLQDLLQAILGMKRNNHSYTSAIPAPKIAHVTTKTSSGSTVTETIANHLSPLVTSAFNYVHDLPLVHVRLPNHIVGPLDPLAHKSQYVQDQDKTGKVEPALYMDDAIASILMGLGRTSRNHGIDVLQVSGDASMEAKEWRYIMGARSSDELSMFENESVKDPRILQTINWERTSDRPYGALVNQSVSEQQLLNPQQHQLETVESQSVRYLDTYGMVTPQFPCSSSCRSYGQCTHSAFDAARRVSRTITAGCENVFYRVSLSLDTQDFDQRIGDPHPDLVCLVAFVSERSALVQNELSKINGTESTSEKLANWNGKIKRQSWALIWLPVDGERDLNEADVALLRIDPSGMFARSVRKAFYCELEMFMKASDTMVSRMMSRIDLPELGPRAVKEKRSGTMITRWVPVPAQKGRTAIFFATEPNAEYIPDSPAAFAKFASSRGKALPSKQLQFYKEAAHWVQTNDLRPEKEIRETVYLSFPYQWVSLAMIVHDLTTEAGRELRCSWYDEYLFWGGNRDAEELSLAYVLGRKRIEGSVGLPPPLEPSWLPLMKTNIDRTAEIEEDPIKQRMAVRENELFLRLIPHNSKQGDDEE